MSKSINEVFQAALETLNAARTPRALAAAHQRVQAAIRVQRRASKETFGPLAQTYRAAVEIWDAQKADGVSKADRLAGLARTIRAAWPFTREWKYSCKDCGDYGLRMNECPGDATCGRTFLHGPHEYGTACWCAKGARFTVRQKETPAEPAPEPKAKRRMTKVGR